jgi:hypothetical protein
MNYNELKQYLINTGDSDFVDIVDSCNEVLEKHNVDDYLLNIENIITNTDMGEQDTKDSIRATLEGLINFILGLYSVKLNDSALFSEKIEICNGLFELSFYSDKDSIKKICESELTDEEKISECLTLVTSFNIEKLLSLISEVDTALITGICNNKPEQSEENSIELESIKNSIDLYSKYKLIVGNKELYSDRYFNNPNTIGMKYDIYLSAFINDSEIDNSDDVEAIAAELIGLCILSDNSSLIVDTIRTSISRITQDINKSTKIDIAVNKLLMDLI